VARHYFPHRVVRLRKGGPDGLKLAQRMCRASVAPAQLWELVLYALPPVRDEFPADLFFDDDIVWHQQQFGLDGHVATAAVVEDGNDLYVLNLVSDVVQRIGRRRDLKTRIENRFKGWSVLLVNAALDLAMDTGHERVVIASADWALAHTDPNRLVQRPLFDRVYDGSVRKPFHARRDGNWWVLDVAANAATVLRAEVGALWSDTDPTVCVCHDIERGWGHLTEDPRFAAVADAEAPEHLARMLDIEATRGVRATYAVVGFLVPELRDAITAGGHCLAFHSFDHAGPGEDGVDDQLRRCRQVDYRLKGYRPAQSHLTAELTETNLSLHNFEWLASSRHSLGADDALLRNGVVRIPILFDDFALHTGAAYDAWEATGLDALRDRRVSAFSLHDCYGSHWLARYEELLRRIGDSAHLRTLDDVAAGLFLAEAV
jgi:hypothetical protein